MKLFCFVFIIYVLLLSLAPCDELVVRAETHFDADSSITAAQITAQTTEQGEDNCSPFCICSCCYFSILYQLDTFTITDKVIVAANFAAENSYRNPYTQNHKTSIWQPPKFNSKA